MGMERFVGRQETVRRLQSVLKGETSADSKLTVQSIEGPGGIGKTHLFDHALTSTDLTDRNYLRLRVDGNEPSAISLVRAVPRMVDSADAEAISARSAGRYFTNVAQVIKLVETIRGEALAEFQKRQPSDQDGQAALLRYLDLAFETGKRINDVSRITRKYLNVGELEKSRETLEQLIPVMVSLREETPGFLGRLGLGGSVMQRNAVKENVCRPLADALVSDLSAILARYRRQDRGKTTHTKVRGIDRLLLVLDDYEKLHKPLGEFLVSYLLPALKKADFESVIVLLGRDQLEATHPGWEQHLKSSLLKRIELHPLSREEMNQLVASYGVRSSDEEERAWQDTRGYPLLVDFWVEEAESGGRTAVMLKRFHDRTTRWMSDEEKHWLQHALFLDNVNKRSLGVMLGGDAQEAERAFQWFEREGSVRDTTSRTFKVREFLRSRLLDYLDTSDPSRYEELQRRAQRAMDR